MPSSGPTLQQFVLSLQDHIRRNHEHLAKPIEFFYRLVQSLTPVRSAEDIHDVNVPIPRTAVEGIPIHRGFICNICQYCGPHKLIQNHINAVHAGIHSALAMYVVEILSTYMYSLVDVSDC